MRLMISQELVVELYMKTAIVALPESKCPPIVSSQLLKHLQMEFETGS